MTGAPSNEVGANEKNARRDFWRRWGEGGGRGSGRVMGQDSRHTPRLPTGLGGERLMVRRTSGAGGGLGWTGVDLARAVCCLRSDVARGL